MRSANQLKSPLRMPGGKTKGIKTIRQVLEEYADFQEYREPFLGGGSVAIYVTKQYPDIKVWVNDLYYPLYNFWTVLQTDGEHLSDTLLEIKDAIGSDDEAHRELFESCQYGMKTEGSFDGAVSFYILNKCSFSGLTENSTFSVTASRNNFTRMNIRKLKEYAEIIQHWKITNLDYSKVMKAAGRDVFMFLDPPYDIKDFLYGTNRELHRNFDHDEFANVVDRCKHRFLLTYNKNDFVLKRYEYYLQRDYLLQYGMVHRSGGNKQTELIITNH
ncbi:Dam Site-specific DNA methylase [Oxalobacteraceae bacterium]